MNTIKKIKFLILTIIGLVAFNSCVQDDDFALPPAVCNDVWVSNLTIDELYDQVDAAGEIISFDTDVILEGYVVSSDSTGNFFKTVSIQNDPVNPTRALQVEMDRTNLFNNYPLGSKIKVNLNGLYAGYDGVLLKVGETYVDGGVTRVGRMADNKINSHVALTCDGIFDIAPVVYGSIQEATSGANANNRINTLVTIQNVQFQLTGVTYADAVNQATVNRMLEGATEGTNGQEIILRNSGFADFAGVMLPEGSGSITAVLSKFNDDWQLFIRDTNDVQFNNPRYEGNGGGGDGAGPIGGDNAQYDSCLSENFESYSVDADEFSAYINDAAAGSRYWQIKSFSNNKYIQMSSFNSDDDANETYFIVPVNFDEADSFSFKTKDGYNNGNALKVYYSTNYTLGGDISAATLNDITSSFTISSGNTSGYGANFIESGSYNLAALSGNGIIAFKYEGSQSVTTTMQIDDISIVDNENPECGGGNPGGTIFEDGFANLNNWTSQSVTGTQVWTTATFGNPAPCAYMSGFDDGNFANEDWLVSNPIAIEAGLTNVTLSFDTDGRFNGNPLEVYYTTNYTGDVTTTTWTSLPAQLDSDLDTWNTWTSSGDLNVSPAIGQNLYIAFKYTSTTSASTTWELDNVKVTGN